MSEQDIFQTVVSGVLSLIIVGAVLEWAAKHTTGMYDPVIDTLAGVTAWILDPSTTLLLLAVGSVITMARSSTF